jgi:hypothetical protein
LRELKHKMKCERIEIDIERDGGNWELMMAGNR